MNLQLKSLLATSALVAVAAAANAQTFSGTSTTAILMTTNTNVITPTFTSTANWSVTTGPAIEISGTGASIISLQSGAVVSSSATTSTITLRENSGITGVTINNSGTIVNSNAAGSAVSTTLGNVPVTINNVGTISGSIDTGTDVDTINNQGGTIRGALNLSSGNNVVTINGGTLTGAVTTTGGNDTLTISSSGLLTGAVDLGAGANVVNVNTNGTLFGNLLTDSGNDTVNVNGGTISGTINLGTGTDTLAISGTSAFTTRGTISGVENLYISNTTANFNHTITGGAALRGNAGSLAAFNVTTTLSGAITTSGTVQVGYANTLTADSANLNGGTLKIDVASSTTAGKLVLAGAASVSGTNILVNMLNNSNYIASGTTLNVIEGTGAATTSISLTNAASEGVFRYSLERGGAGNANNVLRIGRVSASSVVTGEANKAIANAFESLTTAQVTGTLATVQGQINTARSAQALTNVLDSLNPSLSGMGAASVGVTNATGGQVSNRLASLRQGVATGKQAADKHFWVEGFGTMNEQDDKNGARGYESNGGGITFGVDTDSLVDGATVGAAFSYGLTSVESNSTLSNETDIDSYVLTGYGSKALGNDIFVNGMVGLGMNQYEMERTVAGVGTAKASPDGWQGTIKGEVGRDFKAGGWKLTPVAGAQYTHLKVDSYTETGVGAAGLSVDPEKLNAFDLSLGGRAAYDFDVAGGTLTPMLRAGITARAGDTSLDSTSRFIGGGSAFATPGIEADRTSFNLGTGLTFANMGGTEMSADYDANINDSATGHALKLKVRMPF